MTEITAAEVESIVDFYYVEKHIINLSNLTEYKSLFLDILKNTCYYIRFDMELLSIVNFLEDVGFKRSPVGRRYDNNEGCSLDITIAFVNGSYEDYHVLKIVSFEKNDLYPTGYDIKFNDSGLPISSALRTPKKLLRDVRLKSVGYEIDQESFKIEQIWYFIEDNRKYQKSINGYVAMIVEYPLKSIKEKNNTVEGINIYDVHYFTFNKGSLETIHLSDIIRSCEFKIKKMYGSHFTEFLTMYKMFNKRELDLIGMTFI